MPAYADDVHGRPRIVCAAAIEGGTLADAVIGVGKAAAAMRTTQLLLAERPTWLLLIGVCGAYPESGLEVGALCLVGEDLLADEGVALPGGGFMGLAEMGLGEIGPFIADPARTRSAAALLAVPVLRGATVSTCSGDDAHSRALAGRSGAQVETMEGAAVLQVCRALAVPVVQLRCVSNRTGDRERAGWDLRGAIDRLHTGVLALGRAYGWEGMS
jgi:futalosine hydrolase